MFYDDALEITDLLALLHRSNACKFFNAYTDMDHTRMQVWKRIELTTFKIIEHFITQFHSNLVIRFYNLGF